MRTDLSWDILGSCGYSKDISLETFWALVDQMDITNKKTGYHLNDARIFRLRYNTDGSKSELTIKKISQQTGMSYGRVQTIIGRVFRHFRHPRYLHQIIMEPNSEKYGYA